MRAETHIRCAWAETDPLMGAYHDQEWGRPERDGRRLWEALMLDGFQAGLAWITILRKRESFRAAFANFDPERVATFGEAQIEKLLQNPGIIRSRPKIEATISGAMIYLDMQRQGEDFGAWVWSYVDGEPVTVDGKTVLTSTALSEKLSKDLKKRGFKFVGPTIVYAWMPPVGLVNDHSKHCFCREH